MELSLAEVFVSLFIVTVGILGNIILYFKNVSKIEQVKWSVLIYGSALIMLICGLLTPRDILSNSMISIPLIVVFVVIVKKGC